jgi:lysophospholipase L1-like esterase
MRDHACVWLLIGLGVALLLVGCAMAGAGPSPTVSPESSAVQYVALGDSYTIGTSVGEADRWPNQLVARLAGTGGELELAANLGVNGYTSDDLISRELPALGGHRPDFVTVLIGVNDVVRRVPRDRYSANVDYILDQLLARLPANRIVVVSTPDYTLTPSGAAFGDPDQQSAAIADFNEVERAAAAARGIAFVDIGAVARRVAGDLTLVADDGLHPSAKQYSGWVDLVAPVVERLLTGH